MIQRTYKQKKADKLHSIRMKELWQNLEYRNKNKANLGHFHSGETKKKMSLKHIGMKFTEEHKKNLSLNHKGMFGKHHTKMAKSKISLANNGENHPLYKGNNATISVMHRWVERRKSKPEFCEFCNENEPRQLANIKNHQYTRNLDDYKWLCYSCHRIYDLNNSKKIKLGVIELKC